MPSLISSVLFYGNLNKFNLEDMAVEVRWHSLHAICLIATEWRWRYITRSAQKKAYFLFACQLSVKPDAGATCGNIACIITERSHDVHDLHLYVSCDSRWSCAGDLAKRIELISVHNYYLVWSLEFEAQLGQMRLATIPLPNDGANLKISHLQKI